MDLNDKRNKIIHEVLNEMLAREKMDKTLSIGEFIEGKHPDCDLHERNRIIDTMKGRLIAKKEPNSVRLTLTEDGKIIAESKGGWLGYVKKQKEQADTPSKERKEKSRWQLAFLIMAFATVAISVRQCSQQDKTSALEELSAKQAGQINRLKADSISHHHLLEILDKEILEYDNL